LAWRWACVESYSSVGLAFHFSVDTLLGKIQCRVVKNIVREKKYKTAHMRYVLRLLCDQNSALCMVVLLQGGDNPRVFMWSLAYSLRGALGEPVAKPALVGVCVSAI
jgi:hypothetical protein